MAAYYSSNQYYDDDDGESISSGSNDIHRASPGGVGGMGSPYQYDEDGGGMLGGHPDDGHGGMHMGGDGFAGGDGGGGGMMMGSPTFLGGGGGNVGQENMVDFDDPRIASLPRILLMGPRRAGKTSIQRVVFHKMSPHETLFRLEATQMLERAVVDHTPLCRCVLLFFAEWLGQCWVALCGANEFNDIDCAHLTPKSCDFTEDLRFGTSLATSTNTATRGEEEPGGASTGRSARATTRRGGTTRSSRTITTTRSSPRPPRSSSSWTRRTNRTTTSCSPSPTP